MPLYEYHCPDCEQDFERVVRFLDAEKPQACPCCGETNTHRRISAIAAPGRGYSGGESASASNCSGGAGRFT